MFDPEAPFEIEDAPRPYKPGAPDLSTVPFQADAPVRRALPVPRQAAPIPAQTTSGVGDIEWVKGLEGFNPRAYGDYKQMSIGYGTRARKGEQEISQEAAQQRLVEELTDHARRVDDAAKQHGVQLTPHQRDALVSFDFNTGKGADILSDRDPAKMSARMQKYIYAGGKPNDGLVNRRRAELERFNQPYSPPIAQAAESPGPAIGAFNPAQPFDVEQAPTPFDAAKPAEVDVPAAAPAQPVAVASEFQTPSFDAAKPFEVEAPPPTAPAQPKGFWQNFLYPRQAAEDSVFIPDLEGLAIQNESERAMPPEYTEPMIPIPKPEAKGIPSGIARGALEMAEGLETPQNALILGATAVMPPVVQKLVAAGFGADMMRAAPDEIEAARNAKTPGEAAQHWTRAALSFIGGGAIASHAGARPGAGGAGERPQTVTLDEKGNGMYERQGPPVPPLTEPSAEPPTTPPTAAPKVESELERLERIQREQREFVERNYPPNSPNEPASISPPAPAAEVTPPPLPEKASAVRNAATDIDRTALALQPAGEPVRRPWAQVDTEARETLTRDPGAADRLASELESEPRQVTDTESAVLAYRWERAKRELEAANTAVIGAAERGDPAALDAAVKAREQVEQSTQDLADTLRAVGTKAGQGLAARKMFNAEDWSLAGMMNAFRAKAGGAELTQEQAAAVRLQHAKLEEIGKARDTKEGAKSEEAFGAELVKIFKEAEGERESSRPSAMRRVSEVLNTQAEKARGRLAERRKQNGGRLFAGVDPAKLADIGDYAVIGASHIAQGAVKLVEFGARLVKEFGEEIKPHIRAIYDASKQRLLDEAKAASKAVPRATAKGLKSRVEEGGDVSRAYVRRLAKDFIAAGVESREELVDAVHGALEDVKPGISRRETMDLLSGYGEVKPLSTEPVDVKLRAMTGELQQIAKIQDMQAGRAPKKTGTERRTPSDEERRLIKEVEEFKRKGGYTVTDPVTQLKTALAAVQTRLKNELRDLSEQLDTGRKPPGKSPLEYDAETTRLKELRDRVRKTLKEIGEGAERTDEQRIKSAEKALEASVAEYERRIREEDTKPRGPSTQAWSPKIAAMRARRNAVKAQYDELKALADAVDGTAERRALAGMKTRLTARIADLHDRMAREDYGPRAKKAPPTPDAEAVKLRAEEERVKKDFYAKAFAAKLRARGVSEKVVDSIVQSIQLGRSIKTSFDVSAVLRQGQFIVLSHPVRGAKSLPAMFRSLFSKDAYGRVQAEILERENAKSGMYRQAKLYLADMYAVSMSKMEEAYMSRWAKKIPGVAGSERAYISFLNKLRADSFDTMLEAVGGKKASVTDARAIANYINVATGRGVLGKAETAAVPLANIFFSPRFVASRFEMLAGQPLWGKAGRAASRKVKAQIALEYGRYVIAASIMTSLAVAAGAKIQTDPRAGDFGKFRFNHTYIDPGAGLLQTAVLLSRLWTGETKSSSGKVTKLDEAKFGGTDAAGLVGRYLRTKLAPLPGGALNAASGRKVTGEKTTWAKEGLDQIDPMSRGEVLAAIDDLGPLPGGVVALLALFGMGSQVYDPSQKRK